MDHRVVAVPLAHIIDLRVRVLRQGTPVAHCDYPEDALADVVHLAIDQNGHAVATSTWFDKQCPHRPGSPAVQLKGMAVDSTVQTAGLGRALVDAGLDLARSRGAHLVWARARDSAIGFYEKCGFEVVGDGFIDESTAMAHHIVMRDLA